MPETILKKLSKLSVRAMVLAVVEVAILSAAASTASSQSFPSPTQLSPANGSAWSEHVYPRRIKFEWSPVRGAASYGIEINCFHCCVANQWCSDAGKPTHIVRGLREPTYTFDFWGSEPGSWRVWAINGESQDGRASSWWEFTFSPKENTMRFPPLPSNSAPPARLSVSSEIIAPLPQPASTSNAIGSRGLIPRSAPPVRSPLPVPIASGPMSSPIKLIYSPDPSYTDAARKAKITGEVTLSVVVGTDGLVKDASVLRGLAPDLDEAAINTVKTWRFEPERKDGEPVSSTVQIGVNFHLYSETAAKNDGTTAPAAAPAWPWPIKLIYGPDPEYPDSARKMKLNGDVTLSVAVGADGLVKEVSVLRGVTPDMDNSAIKTIKTWRFVPARKDGVAVPFTCQIGVSFRLY